MNTEGLLFLLLRSEFCPDVKEAIAVPPSEDDLKALYTLSKMHDVAHIISNALQKRGLLGKDEASQKFSNAQLVSIYRCEQLKYTFNEICSVLEKERIPYIPLKGSLLRSYYHEEWMRTSCDIDVLVHDEDMKRAVDALVEIGYKTDNKRHFHDMSLYSPNGMHLELHFNIKEHMDNIDGLLSEVWEFSRRESGEGFRYNLTKEFFVFHHIAHMSYHFINGGCGIRPFIDLFVMKRNMGYDDIAVRSYCRQCGIEKFYENVLSVVNVWFGGETHSPISQKIEDYILKGGVYGTLENRVLVAQTRRGGKLKYILSRLFVPYGALKNYYPILNKHKWLFPFMQVGRWIRFFIKGSFKRGLKEIRLNQNIEKEQAESTTAFLKDVGL